MLGWWIIAAFLAAAVAYMVYPPFREWVRGKKLVATGLASAVFGFLETANWSTLFQNPQTAGLVVIGIGVVVVVLRYLTQAPIAKE